MNRDPRDGVALQRSVAEDMVERLLKGEHGKDLAKEFGVDASLPALKAFKWGLTRFRVSTVGKDDLSLKGRQWLKEREGARARNAAKSA